jgi:hypothetical protein
MERVAKKRYKEEVSGNFHAQTVLALPVNEVYNAPDNKFSGVKVVSTGFNTILLGK